MTWEYLDFEHSTCSQESDSNRTHSSLGAEPSPIVKSRKNLAEFSLAAWREAKSTELHAGTMCSPFLKDTFKNLTSRLSPQDSPAQRSALRVLGKAFEQRGQDFSLKSLGSPTKSVLRLFSSKTYGQELESLSQKSGLHLKAWDLLFTTGTLRHAISVCLTKEIDGSPLPTLSKTRYGSNVGGAAGRRGNVRHSLSGLWKLGKLPTLKKRDWRMAGTKSESNRKSPALNYYWKTTTGTNLPVSFCELIWGIPLGTTVLEPWAIPFRLRKSEKPLEY